MVKNCPLEYAKKLEKEGISKEKAKKLGKEMAEEFKKIMDCGCNGSV